MTKFGIQTWQSKGGLWSASCFESRSFYQSLMNRYKRYHQDHVSGFPTRDEALAAIKKRIDDFLLPERTLKDHGEYP